MADIITLLPDHVANQIAAGEVVQRPASVVKELLENAIDAQATQVKLLIKNAGKTLIQVIDNGVGMSTTDARLCFERHATSKIQMAEDLFRIQTMGFRGEALASVAAVAHVELITRTEAQEVATAIRIEGSKVVSQEVVAAPKGTSVAVKNLFFNIPARRNFLKSDPVELRHIIDEFHRVVLAHPKVSFAMYNNGTELFQLPPSNLRRRVVNVFGAKTDERLVPVHEETDMVTVDGFIGKPQYARKSRGEQFFFVNNRYIKSPYLHHAISTACEGLLREKAYPSYFLFLQIDPERIDINIHPTKTEIKFEDEHALYAILKASVKHSLGQFNVTPVLDFNKDPNMEVPYAYKDKGVKQPDVEVDPDFNPFADSYRSSGASQRWEGLYAGLQSQKLDAGIPSQAIQVASEDATERLFDENTERSLLKATGFQLHRKYIVSTIKSGLVIIDQGRAHQRVLYERFLKLLTAEHTVSQQLLFPITLNFSKLDMESLKQMKHSLEDSGFVLELAEENVTVSGVPMDMKAQEVSKVLQSLVDDVRQQLPDAGYDQAAVMAASMARSMSIRTGDTLDMAERETLVNDLFGCKEPLLSPTNQPVFITISGDELDKKFSHS